MNKNILISALALFILFTVGDSSYAKNTLNQQSNIINKQTSVDVQKQHITHSEKKAKRFEYEQRLNLTPEQKVQIEKNRTRDIEEIKPIYAQLKAKRAEVKRIKSNTDINETEKLQQISEIRAQIKTLKKQANELRQENLKAFENLLNDEQKIEFAKIKEEQQTIIQKKKEERKRLRQSNKVGIPVQQK